MGSTAVWTVLEQRAMKPILRQIDKAHTVVIGQETEHTDLRIGAISRITGDLGLLHARLSENHREILSFAARRLQKHTLVTAITPATKNCRRQTEVVNQMRDRVSETDERDRSKYVTSQRRRRRRTGQPVSSRCRERDAAGELRGSAGGAHIPERLGTALLSHTGEVVGPESVQVISDFAFHLRLSSSHRVLAERGNGPRGYQPGAARQNSEV